MDLEKNGFVNLVAGGGAHAQTMHDDWGVDFLAVLRKCIQTNATEGAKILPANLDGLIDQHLYDCTTSEGFSVGLDACTNLCDKC